MSIPDYQTAMLPLLRLAADGKEHRSRDAIECLAQDFALTDEERSEMLPSGTAPLFDNRVGWARTYLKQAGLLTSPKRGVFQITERGKALLAKGPAQINVATLEQFEEFRAFRERRRDTTAENNAAAPRQAEQESPATQTPEDQLAFAYGRLRSELELDLLEQVKSVTPVFFERLVIDLLVGMGYGGSLQDSGMAVRRRHPFLRLGNAHGAQQRRRRRWKNWRI